MAQGRDIMRGDFAKVLHDTQQFTLGERHINNRDQTEWTYVRFDDPVNAGDLVRDSVTVDIATLVASQIYAAVTGAAAIGTHLLIDSGAFTDDDLVGAMGQIVSGTGAGQIFYITKMDNDNQVIVNVLSGKNTLLDSNDDRGWQVALSTSSRYVLRFPGAVKLGALSDADGIRSFPRGLAQQTVVAADTGKFGFVCSRGLCFANILLTGTAPVQDEALIAAASGRVQGSGGSDPIFEDVVAISQFGDITLSPDTGEGLILVDARIEDKTMAFHTPNPEKDPRTGLAIR